MNRPSTLRWLACGLVACSLAVAAPAQDAAFSLKHNYKKGDTAKFQNKLKVIGEANPIELDVLMMTTESVKEIKDDGSFVVESKVDSGGASVMGMELPLPVAGQAFTTTYDKNGNLTEQKTGKSPFDFLFQILASIRTTGLPDKPFKVGEEWKIEVSNPDKKLDKGTVTIKLEGLEKKNAEIAVDTYKLKLKADLVAAGQDGTPMKLKLDAVTYLDKTTGKSLKMEGNIEGLVVPQLGAAKLSVKRVMVKEEPKDK